MEQPVARASRSKQRYIESRKRGACPRARNERERYDRSLAGILLSPCSRFGKGAEYRGWQPGGGSAGARSSTGTLIKAPGLAVHVVRGRLYVTRNFGGLLFSAGV